MAGDWIKMRAALTTCPKVAAMARAIGAADEFSGLSRQAMRLLVVGGLHAVWAAVNEHTSEGVMANSFPEDLDDIAGIKGFGQAMQAAGWLEVDEAAQTLTFPNFGQWNTPAKDTTAAERMRKHREKERVTRNAVTVTAPLRVTVTPDKTRQDRDKKKDNTHTQAAAAADDFRQSGWAADEWARFVAVWNQTPRAAAWSHLTAPDAWVDLAATPGWLDRARAAMAKLPQCHYLERPMAVTQFFTSLDRILAGEFDTAKQDARRKRQPVGGNL